MNESFQSGEAPREGETLRASSPGAGQIDVDMPVVGKDGEPVGRVKEVRETDFLVDRPMAPDVYVPYGFVLAVENQAARMRGGPEQLGQVILTVSAAHVDTQGWPHA